MFQCTGFATRNANEPLAAFEAYERMLRSDVKYRFSIDMSSLSRAA